MSEVRNSGLRSPVSGLQGRRALFLALGAVLLAAIGLIVYGETRPLKRTFYGSVKDLLPTEAEVPGWNVEYLPIADTPEMQAKVDEALNYDDAVYAVFTQGEKRVSIYIAYWTPGKMSPRLIAGHTPDVCWTANGWTIESAKSGVAIDEVRKLADDDILLLAEQRTMRFGNTTEFLLFWHLLDGEPQLYPSLGRPPWYAAIKQLLERGINQRPEQHFIRISCNRNITEWKAMEGTIKLVETLATRVRPLGGTETL